MDVTKYNPISVSEDNILALLDSISLPRAEAISKLSTQGSYHLVYVLDYQATVLQNILSCYQNALKLPHHQTRLLLRISGTQYPSRKTENESAILAFVARHAPSIPIPLIVRHDNSTSNPIGFEYQIMTVCPGVEVDSIFRQWSHETKLDFLDQVTELLTMMHAVPVTQIGGFAFRPDNGGAETYGPLCDEFNWQSPGIEQYWLKHGLEESPETLNAQGPFNCLTELHVGWLEKYIYAIQRHPYMVEFQAMMPALEKFKTLLSTGGPPEWKLNDMRMVLAHRDLHFGNILYDTESKKITGVIDWEFSGSAPFSTWDPPKAFLGSLPYDQEGIQRKRGWVKDFQDRCTARGIDWRSLIFDQETGWSSPQQQLVDKAMNYTRCIFEVAPTGERLETVRGWQKIVEDSLAKLGVT